MIKMKILKHTSMGFSPPVGGPLKKHVKLHLFDTGYCLNFEKMMAKDRPMKIQRFYAMVGLIEHPKWGPILFDTGYSPHVIKLCRKFPYFFYSLLRPIRSNFFQSAVCQIHKFGYQPKDIKHIIISHFHPDHIGGLKDFSHAQFYGSLDAYTHLKKLSFLKAMKEVFFQDLLPNDFENRFKDIRNNGIKLPFRSFKRGFDLFGDRSIIAVNLPGHALGQYGIIVQTASQSVFLVADACWQSNNCQKLECPHPIVKPVINNYPAYCDTLNNLKILKSEHPQIEIISSHCQKMWAKYVVEGQIC